MIYLTEKYNKFFDKGNILSYFRLIALIPSFVSDILKSGKLKELTSFLRWEVMYHFKLFSKNSFIKIDKNYYIDATQDFTLELEKLEKIVNNFNENNNIFKAEIIDKAISVVFFDYYRNKYLGVEYKNNKTLLISNDGLNYNVFYQFDDVVHAIYVTINGTILLNSGNKIHRKNELDQFEKVLELSSPNSFLRHNSCFSEDNFGNIYIAEYGLNWDKNSNWLSLAFLYISRDNGLSWEKIDFFKDNGANKHLHLVFFDNIHKNLIVTDGDNHKRLWINYSMKNFNKRAEKPIDDGWFLYNKTHFKKGGHISANSFKDKLVMGSDYLGGQNFLITSDDLITFKSQTIPDPYRRNPINSLIKMNLDDKPILWASIHAMQNFGKSHGLIMFTNDLVTWKKVFEYKGTQFLTSMISTTNYSTRYIFLLIRNTDESKNEIVTLRISGKN